MFSNADNSNIEINVDKGGNGMSKGTVPIDISEYKELLKAKFDLEMVKDVLLNRAGADWSGKYLTWCDQTTSAVLRYIMGDAYDKKLEELTNKEDGE